LLIKKEGSGMMTIAIWLSAFLVIVLLVLALAKYFIGYFTMRFAINAFDKIIYCQIGTDRLDRVESYWARLRYLLVITHIKEKFVRGCLAKDDDVILVLWALFEGAKRFSWKFTPWYDVLDGICHLLSPPDKSREDIGEMFAINLYNVGGQEFVQHYKDYVEVAKQGYPQCYMDGVIQVVAYMCSLVLQCMPRTVDYFDDYCARFLARFEDEYIVIPSLS